MNSLITLWEKVLGTPPNETQFAIWGELHTPKTIRKAILTTARKNQILDGQMSQDHRIRFASKVMQTATEQDTANAENRERLRVETEGGPDGVKSENRGSNVCH